MIKAKRRMTFSYFPTRFTNSFGTFSEWMKVKDQVLCRWPWSKLFVMLHWQPKSSSLLVFIGMRILRVSAFIHGHIFKVILLYFRRSKKKRTMIIKTNYLSVSPVENVNTWLVSLQSCFFIYFSPLKADSLPQLLLHDWVQCTSVLCALLCIGVLLLFFSKQNSQ